MTGSIATRPRASLPSADTDPWILSAPEVDSVSRCVREDFESRRPDLAAFPGIATMVFDEAQKPNANINKLLHLVEHDPAMIATILRAANSVVHGRCLSVTNVRSAIVRLGALRVAKLAVGVACRALFDVEHKTYRRLFPACFTRLYHSAMTEAFTASFMAENRRLPASRDLFLATMLHEVGKSLALQSLAATVALGKIRSVPAPESVEKIIAREHGYIGTLALRTWRMPVSIVETCRRQTDHQVPHAPAWTDAHVIRVVSSINDFRMGATHADGPKWVLRDSSRALGMDRDAVLEVAKWVSEQADQCAALFAVPNRVDEPGYEEVVAGIVEG